MIPKNIHAAAINTAANTIKTRDSARAGSSSAATMPRNDQVLAGGALSAQV